MLNRFLSLALLLLVCSEGRPEASEEVHVFYGEGFMSLEALDLVAERLEDPSRAVEYHFISDEWSRHLLQRFGISEEGLDFAVVTGGGYRAVIDSDTVSFTQLPLCLHGCGGREGDWTLQQLLWAVSSDSLIVGAVETQPSSGDLAARILEDAVSYMGTPYVWGGTTENGFDCSGLPYRVFNDNGVPLPRSLGDMERMGVAVDRQDLMPGDLLIFESPRHAGIYLGEGEFIHCSSYQDRGVVITPLSHSNYQRRYSGAVRILGTGSDF